MAGLLDIFSNPDSRLAIGLLSAAGPSREPLSFGQRMGGLMAQLDQQKRLEAEDAARKEERALKARMMGLQEQQILQQLAAQKQAQEEAQRQMLEQQRMKAALRAAFQPVAGTEANAVSGVTGPRPDAAASIGQRKPVDWQGLIAAGIPADLVKSLAQAPNLGRSKVARTVEVMGPNGPETVQVDEYGDRVGQGFAKPVELKFQDLGGKVSPLNPYTGAEVGRGLNKSNTPDALLSAQTAMRGQNMTDARAREKNAIDRDSIGKVEWKQDVNGAWVGLPKEVAGTGPVTPVATTVPGKREQQARNALDIIAEAEKLIDKGTGSYLGAAVDLGARAFGAAPPGAVAAGQLKALEGALMMAQPRMEGPQSNQDVKLYQQMAAQIGDSTVPPPIKKAALSTIKALHRKYAGQDAPRGTAEPALDDLLKKYGN